MREEWRYVTFADVARWSSGKGLAESDRLAAGRYPLHGANGVIGRTNRALYDQPVITIGRVGAIGEVHVTSGPAWVSDNALVARPRDGVDLPFLQLLLETFDFSSIRSGTTQPLITQGALIRQRIALPSPAVQRRIVDLAAVFDRAVTETFSLADVTSTALVSIRKSIFSLDAERAPLIDAIRLRRGYDLPSDARGQGSFPVVASNGIVGTHDVAIVHGPGVVTGRSGTIGRVFSVEGGFWPLNTTLYVEDFRGNDPRFVRHLLTELHLETFAGGSTVPSLNRNVLDQELVFRPSVDRQVAIADLLDAIEGVVVRAQVLAERCRAMRSLVVKAVLSGTHEIPTSYDRFLDGAA